MVSFDPVNREVELLLLVLPVVELSWRLSSVGRCPLGAALGCRGLSVGWLPHLSDSQMLL